MLSTSGTSFRNRMRSYSITSRVITEADVPANTPDTASEFRVLIVDRDLMSSGLLANALVRDQGCEAVAVTADSLFKTLSTSEVQLVVVGAEVISKYGNGFDLAHAMGSAYPSVSIVMLLNQTTQESVIAAFRAGARGAFSREQPMEEFLDCVEHVRKGFIWAGRHETTYLLEVFKCLPSPNLVTASDSPALTPRELQVVQHAARGKTNKAIALDLSLSEHTVKNYLFRAFEKLGVTSRVELLFYLTMKGHTFCPTNTPSLDLEVYME